MKQFNEKMIFVGLFNAVTDAIQRIFGRPMGFAIILFDPENPKRIGYTANFREAEVAEKFAITAENIINDIQKQASFPKTIGEA